MKLSVVIPTYNRAHLLPGMIHSLFRQAYDMIEIVVVDDGSHDDTARVIEKLELESQRGGALRYYKQSNRGASAARNNGVRQATGDFILFADSDDSVLSAGIEAGMATLIQDGLDYVYLPIRKAEFKGGLRTETTLGYVYDGSDAGLLDYHWHTMGVIYKKSFLERVGGWNESIRTSDDWEFQVRVKLAAGKSRFVDMPLGIWNLHEGARLSAKSYQSSYVADLLSVCESIRDHCARAGRLSDVVKTRLFRRLSRHAVEAGSHGDFQLRQQILKVSCSLAIRRVDRAFQIWLQVVSYSTSDRLLYSMIRRVFR